MNTALLDLHIDVSKPVRSSVIRGASVVSYASSAPVEYVLRDKPLQRIHLFDGSERAGIDVDEVLFLGAKTIGDFTKPDSGFCFYSDAFTGTPEAGYEAVLNLYTEQFLSSFRGGTVSLMVEVGIRNTTTTTRRTIAQFRAVGVYDVVRGDEGAPASGNPEYVTFAEADARYVNKVGDGQLLRVK